MDVFILFCILSYIADVLFVTQTYKTASVCLETEPERWLEMDKTKEVEETVRCKYILHSCTVCLESSLLHC